MIMATSTAIMAMTTSSSINVKAALEREPTYFVRIRVPSIHEAMGQPRGAVANVSNSKLHDSINLAIVLARFLFLWIATPYP